MAALGKDWTVGWRESGGAVVFSIINETNGRNVTIINVWEAVGNVQYQTRATIYSDDSKEWSRASALYNKLADTLAKAQGIQREPVDLLGGDIITPNPADYSQPAAPDASLV